MLLCILVPAVLLTADAAALDAATQRRLEQGLLLDRDAPRPAAPAQTPQATQSIGPDVALAMQAALARFSTREPLMTGAHDPHETGFNLQGLEVHAGANADPFLRFDASAVLSPHGVELEEAFGTTLALPGNLQLRAGQFLTQLGRQNPTHAHAWVFVDQPLVLGKFLGPEGSRGIGTEVGWLSPLPWYVEIVVAVTGASGDCCARSFYGAEEPAVRAPRDLLYTGRVEQFFELGQQWSLLWGLSGQLGPNASGAHKISEIYATDLYLRHRPTDVAGRTSVSLQAEVLWRRRHVPRRLLDDVGGYAQIEWRVDAQWAVAARHEHVTGVDDDPLDPLWSDDRWRSALLATYMPSHFTRVRLQGGYDRPRWLAQGFWSTFLALELAVGAHAAHPY